MLAQRVAGKAGCKTITFEGTEQFNNVTTQQLYTYLHGAPCTTIHKFGNIIGYESVAAILPQLGIPLMRELLPAAAAGKYLTLGNGSNAAGPANPVVDDLHALVNTFINEVSAHGNVYSMFSYQKDTVVGYTTNAQPALAPLWENGTRVPRGWSENASSDNRLNTYTRTKDYAYILLQSRGRFRDHCWSSDQADGNEGGYCGITAQHPSSAFLRICGTEPGMPAHGC
ncbi:hypothetical protein [Herpetosiphon llansteffanensis]|uniref:hypothetical protein n=1 Tax=Herpetosiphon llansteffanensis TaxID=2094568 RepID=UPI000D7BCE5D|nr:hypothetical protein [Herpetosiphon llansteffanensis]